MPITPSSPNSSRDGTRDWGAPRKYFPCDLDQERNALTHHTGALFRGGCRRFRPLKNALELENFAAQKVLLRAIKQRGEDPDLRKKRLHFPANACLDFTIGAEHYSALLNSRVDEICKILTFWKYRKHPPVPKTLNELLAYSLMVSSAQGEDKQRLRVPVPLRTELHEEAQKVCARPLRAAPGGATFFGSLTCQAANHNSTMLLPGGHLPVGLLQLQGQFNSPTNISFITDAGRKDFNEIEATAPGIGNHFNLHIKKDSIKLHPRIGAILHIRKFPGLELLVTGTVNIPGFNGKELTEVRKLTKGHDAAFISGLGAIKTSTQRKIYIAEAREIGMAGVMNTLVYSEPTNSKSILSLEPRTLLRLAKTGCIDMLSMNATEAEKLVTRICRSPTWKIAMISMQGKEGFKKIKEAKIALKAAKHTYRVDKRGFDAFYQHPAAVDMFASVLQNILSEPIRGGIPLVRIRAFAKETIAIDRQLLDRSSTNGSECEKGVELLQKMQTWFTGARDLALGKALLPHGWMRDASEIRLFHGEILSTHQEAAKYARNAPGQKVLNRNVPRHRSVFLFDNTKQLGFSVVPFGYIDVHNLPGGTISVGDCVDELSMDALVSHLLPIYALPRTGANPFQLRYAERFSGITSVTN